jgi:hypothetical protein
MKKTLFLGALCVAGAAAAVEPSSSSTDSSASNADPMICRTQQDTTSLVGRVRVCMTREQWARQRRNGPPGRTTAPRTDSHQQ